jgi:ribosome-binding protein aMBF1 (putative translation factor)
MDISLTPDIYTPSVDEKGNYIDNIPPINHGLKCLCGSKKDVAFETKVKFSAHTKTKVHQKWLVTLNHNKANHYTKMLRYKELVENQQKIIAEEQRKHSLQLKELETKLRDKEIMIELLNSQLTKTNHVLKFNLLD